MAVASRRSQRKAAAAEDAPAAPRTRVAAARGAWATGSVLRLIARLIRLVAWIVALIIVVGIILKVTGANPGNVIVKDIHDVGSTLVGPFGNLFKFKNPKVSTAVNWGVAAAVYLIVGLVVAGLIARIAPRGVHPSEPVAA